MSALTTVADLLDKLAEEVERETAVVEKKKGAVAETKVAAAPAIDPVKVAAEVTRTAIGKDVSPETAAKIAADKELFDVVEKLAAEKSKPTPMGGPAEEKTASQGAGETKRDRLSSAFENWGSAISRNA